jgi:hypothetical protein
MNDVPRPCPERDLLLHGLADGELDAANASMRQTASVGFLVGHSQRFRKGFHPAVRMVNNEPFMGYRAVSVK